MLQLQENSRTSLTSELLALRREGRRLSDHVRMLAKKMNKDEGREKRQEQYYPARPLGRPLRNKGSQLFDSVRVGPKLKKVTSMKNLAAINNDYGLVGMKRSVTSTQYIE